MNPPSFSHLEQHEILGVVQTYSNPASTSFEASSAVFQRYGKLSDMERRAVNDFEYIYRDRFQILKSIQCFLYQCAEGDIPETSELYKMLRELEHRIMHGITDHMKEYQNAKWN